MPAFDNKHLDFFGAISGAFSEVTKREAEGDKSVTLDKHEKSVLEQVYSKNLFTRAGGADPDGKQTHHEFKIYNTPSKSASTHSLSIKYPKRKGNELRLYFLSSSGFYPKKDDIWFIFTKENEPTPYIGFISTLQWENLIEGGDLERHFEEDYSLDFEDDEYQKAVASPQAQKAAKQVQVTQHQRNATLAASLIRSSKYKCEFDRQHATFTSAATNHPYVEAHHLIPVSKSKDFSHSLDIASNIVVLCPNCHKAIHYGDTDTKWSYLEKFFLERHQELSNAGIGLDLDQLLSYYGLSKT
mgnify:CR=1 FL=1